MKVLVEPTDFQKCTLCQQDCLVVAFWDEQLNRSRTMLVQSDFDYAFTQREKHGILVVWNEELVLKWAHANKCPSQPENPPAGKVRERAPW